MNDQSPGSSSNPKAAKKSRPISPRSTRASNKDTVKLEVENIKIKSMKVEAEPSQSGSGMGTHIDEDNSKEESTGR